MVSPPRWWKALTSDLDKDGDKKEQKKIAKEKKESGTIL